MLSPILFNFLSFILPSLDTRLNIQNKRKNQLIKRQFFVKTAYFCWDVTYRIARTFMHALTEYLNKREKVKSVAIPLERVPYTSAENSFTYK